MLLVWCLVVLSCALVGVVSISVGFPWILVCLPAWVAGTYAVRRVRLQWKSMQVK